MASILGDASSERRSLVGENGVRKDRMLGTFSSQPSSVPSLIRANFNTMNLQPHALARRVILFSYEISRRKALNWEPECD